MKNGTVRVPADQQYKLILECRSSGLSDYQWCKEHGIAPATFYNWVCRFRKKASFEIPAPASRGSFSPAPQDIVKLNLAPRAGISAEPVPSLQPYSNPVDAAIEITMSGTTIRIANHADPDMLDHILSFVRNVVC